MTFQPPAESFAFEGGYLPRKPKRIIQAKWIRSRIKAIAEQVLSPHMMRMHAAGIGTTTVSLLDGCAPFYAGLRNHLRFVGHTPVQLSASSYIGTKSGPLKIDQSKLPIHKVKDRVVYLIDDLVDTGQTMSKLKAALYIMGALLVITIVLIDKPDGRKPDYVAFTPDVIGLKIPLWWIFGFGMDDGVEIGDDWAGGKEWPLDNSWVRNLMDIYCYDEAEPTLISEVDLSQIILKDPTQL